jgi:hypothetical protein
MGVATALAIGTAAYSGYQAYSEGEKKKSAKKALENLPVPEATNVGNGLQVSTKGTDLRTKNAQQVSASAIDALRGSGTRGVIGGVGAVQAQNNAIAESNASNLDEQQKNIDQIKAQDNIRLQGIGENRFQQNVSALSSQYNSAQDAQNQAIANGVSSLTTVGSNIDSKSKKNKINSQRTPIEPVSQIQAIGLKR